MRLGETDKRIIRKVISATILPFVITRFGACLNETERYAGSGKGMSVVGSTNEWISISNIIIIHVRPEEQCSIAGAITPFGSTLY